MLYDYGSIIDWDVKSPFKLKGKYAFRIFLTFEKHDKVVVQQRGGFSTKSQANKARDKIIAELHYGKYVYQPRCKLGEYMDWWLENVVKREHKANTYDSYYYQTKNHIKPTIGSIWLQDLNQSHLTKALSSIASSVSLGVAKQDLVILRSALVFAEVEGLVSVNPAKNYKLPVALRGTPTSATDNKIHIDTSSTLSFDQVIRLLLASVDSPIFMEVLFAVCMGLRKSEIIGIKYSDIDFTRRVLLIRRQLGKDYTKPPEQIDVKQVTRQEINPKTKSSSRELIIPDCVFAAILEKRKWYEAAMRRRRGYFQDLDFVCCSSYGRPRSRAYLFEPFKKLLAKCDLPDVEWRSLRRTHATLLYNNNVSLKAISVALGHATQAVTMEHYIDRRPVLIPKAAKNMDEFVNDLLPDWETLFEKRTMIGISDEDIDKGLLKACTP